MVRSYLRRGLSACVCLLLAGCAGVPDRVEETSKPVLKKVAFSALPGWRNDNLQTAFQAFLKSCPKLLQQPAEKPFRPYGQYADFHRVCRQAAQIAVYDGAAIRRFFEQSFEPYQVIKGGASKADGLFTGYYEASLNGSLTRHGRYQTPLYPVPSDLVTADLGQWYPELSGKTITAKVKNGKLLRYPARAEIDRKGIAAARPVVWVDDPVDAFFLHIQGSGVVQLDTGKTLRVGYAGKNGHEYYAIGRALIDRGALTKETVSLQSIRAWMEDHPQEAQSLMDLNPSYVFFRSLETEGPVGAQGVVLTAHRSLAVDKTLYDYGVPVWLVADHPQKSDQPLQTLMIAQDTGGAIRGVVRGDVFWGYGTSAEQAAGLMKSKGGFWFLIPKKTML